MDDREAIKGLQNIVDYWTLNPHEQDCAKTAISALQEREERSKGCRLCFDATIEPDLEGSDLSYHDVGKSEQQKRILIKSGNRKHMAIMFEEWSGKQWHTVGIYEPKFCPECGRPLKGADNG